MEKEFAKKRQELAILHKSAKNELDKSNKKLKQQAKSSSKKEQKDVNKQIAASELELKSRNKSEIEELESKYAIRPKPSVETSVLDFDAIDLKSDEDIVMPICTENESTDSRQPVQDAQPKISKAEKRRRKKADEERDLQKRIQAAKDEQAKNLGKSPAFLEQKYISEHLKELNLNTVSIRSDGSCLYAAILKSQTGHVSESQIVSELRENVAEFLEKHQENYAGFIEGDFTNYLKGVRDGSLWGGELELTIISKLLNIEVIVVKWNQNTGCEINKFCPENESSSKAVITYHKHLGQSEHYNGTTSL
jgi:hypothetical protein